MSLLQIGGKPGRTENTILGLIGFVLLIAVWWLLAEALAVKRPIVEGYTTRLPSTVVPDADEESINVDSLLREDSIRLANATEFQKVYPLLPLPGQVLQSYVPLYKEDKLLRETFYSIWLNVQGYFWAVLLCIPIGLLIGLVPLFKGLFDRQVNALRYLPLTALTGLFIIWFGIEDQMKIAFLAFGIIVYLLPVVVQRVEEVEDVYLKTVFTLGATDWQTIRTVYFPSVMAKLMDDIRVLTAISWTYIIIAELLNRQGGIGSLIYVKARQGQIEKVFAILIVIILIGFIQDRIFVYADRRLFPHKHYKTIFNGLKETEYGILTILGIALLVILQNALFPTASEWVSQIAVIGVLASVLIIIYGEFKFQRAYVE
ncbi:MAG TPA: ABC transporter permease subunit [Saprospiraceae bacterium]|nr:ABC transporter permease subunit [Saprospiraceae bacterium]HMP13340.1 ABC transporter permease subunit [Saprospiraceae bacterium]